MKTRLSILFCAIITLILLESYSNRKSAINDYIIQKKNGKVILAYKAFGDFLNSDKTWKSFKAIVLDPYPSVIKVQNRQIKWGDLDTLKFRNEVQNFKREDFEKYMSQYDLQTINFLYDSVIEMSHKILPPVTRKEVDLCFFLPYGGGCFVIPEDSLNTIYISMYINPAEAEKIMVHEYAHILHIDRRPKEPLSLKREVISEGMAVYLTNRIIKNMDVSNSIPFMPHQNFEWCVKNEELIKDSIKLELNDTTNRFFKRYISDGDSNWARPPIGFVQKTAYFIGYRIIEKCIHDGIPLEEICSLNSDMVIRKSEYFK
jgi:uncharacterized protein YjaZ